MLPYNKHKYNSPSLITPAKHLEYYKQVGRFPSHKPPKTMLFCYQTRFLAEIQKTYRMRSGEGCFRELFFFEDFPDVAIADFGIGAPVVAAKFELLIAWGIKDFISFGTAGAISKDLQIGDIVLCEKALRDEGTSHHYLPFEPYSYPCPCMKQMLAKTLVEKKITFKEGPSWTTDVFYRQTESEIRQLQMEGVLTVEMEAAALFAIASCYNVSLACLFTISDTLGSLEWSPHFHHDTTWKSWNQLLETALATAKMNTSA